MPALACWACGRRLYTVAPLEALFAEERRCPRCGAMLGAERRVANRRTKTRRSNPLAEPGPSLGEPERRVAERRQETRRES